MANLRFRRNLRTSKYKTDFNQENLDVKKGDDNVILVPVPSNQCVEHYLAKWRHQDGYEEQEQVLNWLFIEQFPQHNNLQEVMTKVATLNSFYSTRIPNIYDVANGIMQIKNIEERLNVGDVDLVDEIWKSTEPNPYSFSTKYCSRYNPAQYPIYDSYVAEILYEYNKLSPFDNFTLETIYKNYPNFYNAIKNFKDAYQLDYSLKEVDQFLWQIGKSFKEKKKKQSKSQ